MGKKILAVLSAILIIVSLCLIFVYVPTEAQMGVIQRIFYWHVPVAWVGLLAFFITFIASILYLLKREIKWDHLASAAAEIGVIFTTLLLITGSIWAKPIWGVWWTWDTRLTTSLILWFIYIAYLIIRSYIVENERRARIGAIIGIVGFLDVPIVALAINLWPTQHPSAVIFEGGLEPPMLLTLLVSITAFTVFFALLLIIRKELKEIEYEVESLKQPTEEE